MNEPDTRFETSIGQYTAVSGQDQDSDPTPMPTEKELADDLRVIVRTGKNLSARHCRSLRGIPKLTEFVRIETESQLGVVVDTYGIDLPIKPVIVRRIVRSAINYLFTENRWKDDGAEMAHYAEVLYRLFGFTKDTARGDAGLRWAAAIAYYRRHLNTRGRSTEEANFRRRIYEDELLPALVHELLKAEAGLRGDNAQRLPAINTTGAWILHRWKYAYWVAFRIRWHLSAANGGIASYLLWRQDESLVYEEEAQHRLRESLYHIAILIRFARDPWISQVEIDGDGVLNYVLRYVDEQFSFGKADQEWLDYAVDECLKTFGNTMEYPREEPTDFITRLNEDPQGKLILGKYTLILNSCQCQLAYDDLYLNEDPPPRYYRSPYEGDETCSVFQLSKRLEGLDKELNTMWLIQAQVSGMETHGGVPSRQP